MKTLFRILIPWAAALIAFLGLAEAALRWSGAYITWEEANGRSYASPYQVHTNNALHTRPPRMDGAYSQPEFSFTLKTNSLGIRDVEHAEAKPPDATRMVVLGDSLVEGQGAPFEDAWPKVLEKMLNGGGKTKPFEVIMGGVAGSDPFYCFKLLEKRLLEFKPDCVILALNSVDIPDVAVRGGMERFGPDGRVTYKKAPWWEPIFAKSRLVRLVSVRLLGCDWVLHSPSQRERFEEQARKHLIDLAAEMQRLSHEADFKLLFVLLPYRHEAAAEAYDHELSALAGDLQSAGFHIHDVLPAMRRAAAREGSLDSLFWERDWHPTPRGYAVIAESVLDGLKELKCPSQSNSGMIDTVI